MVSVFTAVFVPKFYVPGSWVSITARTSSVFMLIKLSFGHLKSGKIAVNLFNFTWIFAVLTLPLLIANSGVIT